MSDEFEVLDGTWFSGSGESLRVLAEERLLVSATELVSAALEKRGRTRSWLANRLGIGKSEVTQRLNGRRNLTLRSFADMLHALEFEPHVELRDVRAHGEQKVYVRNERAMGWPSADMMYSQTGPSLRLINCEGVA